MRCDKCNQEYNESEIHVCKNVDNRKFNIFLIIFTIVSLIIVGVFVVVFIFDTDKKTLLEPISTTTLKPTILTKNVGKYSSIYTKAYPQETVIATFNDKVNKKSTNVDITLNRYIYGDELNNLISNYTSGIEIIPGFNWHALEYNIKFNDLDYLSSKIDPTIDVSVFNNDANPFILIDENYYKFNIVYVNNELKIGNNESLNLIVLYYIPDGYDLSLCFGDIKNVLGCFYTE